MHDARAGGTSFAVSSTISLDIGGDGAEVALIVGRVNVDDRLDRVMRDDRRARPSRFSVAKPPTICEASSRDAGIFSSDDNESSQYCGVCATIG